MSKRKRSYEEDIDRYKNKIQRLEKKLSKRRVSASVSKLYDEDVIPEEDPGADTPALRPDDWLLDWPEDANIQNSDESNEPLPGPSTVTEEQVIIQDSNPNVSVLDTEILEILGDDPSVVNKYGPEIRTELANRLLHIIKEGLTKENRKNLVSKYLPPSNCIEMDSPKLNLEIKAAIPEAALKRDKGIEIKQKQMCSAIVGLTDIINFQLNAKTKDNNMLQKLMDVNKILCDLQYADSITRRRFILFALKKDMKEHLKNTKIDTYLFGENLADTLKSARAVNKSGIELKADSNNKTVENIYKRGPARPLNRKAPLQARRPPAGTALPPMRSHEPAAARSRYATTATQHQPPHAHSSKKSSRGQQYPHRRN